MRKSSVPERMAESLAKHLQESLDEGLSSYIPSMDMSLKSVRFEDGELKLVFAEFGKRHELVLKPIGLGED